MNYGDLIANYRPIIDRESDGIFVEMFSDGDNSVFIYYKDSKTGTEFVLNPAKHLAIDAYTHPVFYANAALNGIENPRRLNPARIAA